MACFLISLLFCLLAAEAFGGESEYPYVIEHLYATPIDLLPNLLSQRGAPDADRAPNVPIPMMFKCRPCPRAMRTGDTVVVSGSRWDSINNVAFTAYLTSGWVMLFLPRTAVAGPYSTPLPARPSEADIDAIYDGNSKGYLNRRAGRFKVIPNG